MSSGPPSSGAMDVRMARFCERLADGTVFGSADRRLRVCLETAEAEGLVSGVWSSATARGAGVRNAHRGRGARAAASGRLPYAAVGVCGPPGPISARCSRSSFSFLRRYRSGKVRNIHVPQGRISRRSFAGGFRSGDGSGNIECAIFACHE